MPANLDHSAEDTGLEKVNFHSNPKEVQCQRMFKLSYNCTHFTCKQGLLRILQAMLQKYLKRELQYVQAGFKKGRGLRYQIGNLHWVIDKARKLQENFYLFDYAKAFACVYHRKLQNS